MLWCRSDGDLMRAFIAGKWQALLEVPDTENGGGKYQRVKLLEKRPALSEMREILAEELQLGELFACLCLRLRVSGFGV